MSELMTSVEKAMQSRVVRDKNCIPPITHPMGKNLRQPDMSSVVIDNTHAMMSKEIFDGLSEYSCSIPTGVYEGKCWKRHNGIFDHAWQARGGKPFWQLCWFGFCDKPDCCSTNIRTILIV